MKRTPKKRPEAQPEAREDKKERYTLNLPASLIEQARNASWHTRKPLTQIAEDGLRRELQRLEKENGGPFPRRTSSLPVGRPLT